MRLLFFSAFMNTDAMPSSRHRSLLTHQPKLLRALWQTAFVLQVLFLCESAHAQTPTGDRLKDLAPPDFEIGGVLGGYDTDLSNLPILGTIEEEFTAVTAKAFMPFGPWTDNTQPINTQGLTQNVNWAVNNGKRVHAHVLVYPTENVRLPWFQALPDEQVESTLAQYVATMAGSTSGQVWVWDVVNEVVGDNGDTMDADGLRIGLGSGDDFVPYKEYAAMGPDYIVKAFEWAKAADPNALLIINEYSAETLGDKSDRLFNLCVRLRDQGVPIDGVGFQNHWLDIRYEPNYESIRANFQRFADAGFKLFITECDIAAKHTRDPANDPPNSAELDRQQRIFGELLQIALDQPACKSFLMWDFTDDSSWLQNTNFTLTLADRRPGQQDTILPPGTSMFATPFSGGDGQTPIQAKSAYFALQSAFVNHTGSVYRITSGWQPETSYLGRLGFPDENGNYFPSELIYAEALNDVSFFWSSLKWRLEKVDSSVYRISNLWENQNDYLTRQGFAPDYQTPSDTLALQNREPNWFSQLWFFERTGTDGGVRITNGWSPGNGVLTREASGQDAAGNYVPGPQLRLYPQQNWTSQIWFLDRIPN